MLKMKMLKIPNRSKQISRLYRDSVDAILCLTSAVSAATYKYQHSETARNSSSDFQGGTKL